MPHFLQRRNSWNATIPANVSMLRLLLLLFRLGIFQELSNFRRVSDIP